MTLLKAFISALVLLFATSSSYARSQEQDIQVQALKQTPARWVSAVSRKLERVMVFPQFINEVPKSGIVSVSFRADGANRPTALTVTRKSGDRRLDRAAMLSITRLGTLPAMPDGFRSGQRFVANLLFAANYADYDRQVALLRKEARTTRIASTGDPDALAMVITSYAGAGS